jgi:hypothetical protein
MNLTGSGVALRFLFALLLVLLSYNPSGYSFFHWIYHNISHITPYWGIYIKATLNSLGVVGIVVLAALFASLIWLFVYWGFLSVTNISAMAWVIEVLLAALLAVGMCWSHFTRRMSGQVDVDEIEEK